MKVGGWLVAPATDRLIFEHDPQRLWQQVVNTIGSEITRDVLKIRNLPEDPQNN